MNALIKAIGFGVIVLASWWLIMAGGSFEAFIDLPSVVFLVLVVGGGLAFSGALPTGFAAVAASMTGQRVTDPHRLRRYLQSLDAAYQLTWAAAIVGMFCGLIAMLTHMSDPSSIGSGMAVAMVPMLYSAVVAELLISPLRRALVLASTEADDPQPAARTAPAVGHARAAAIASVVVAVLIFFITLAAFSEIKSDREYQEVTDAIRDAFGHTTTAPSSPPKVP